MPRDDRKIYVVTGAQPNKGDVYVPGTLDELVAKVALYEGLGMTDTPEYVLWVASMDSHLMQEAA